MLATSTCGPSDTTCLLRLTDDTTLDETRQYGRDCRPISAKNTIDGQTQIPPRWADTKTTLKPATQSRRQPTTGIGSTVWYNRDGSRDTAPGRTVSTPATAQVAFPDEGRRH